MTTSQADTFGERMKAARERLGWAQEALAREAGVSLQTIRRYESRGEPLERVTPSVKKVSKAAGVHTEWLNKGKGEMLLPGQGDGAREKPVLAEETGSQTGSQYVEARGIVVCAGDGAEPEQYETHLVPVEQYSRDHATAPPRAGEKAKWYAKVMGDSMAPELFDGAWYPVELVQHKLTEAAVVGGLASGLYVVHYAGFLQFKRIQPLAGGRYRLLCTNPAYHDEELSGEQADEVFLCARVKLNEREQLVGSVLADKFLS